MSKFNPVTLYRTVLIALAIVLFFNSNSAFAALNATIVNGDVNLRASYPTFQVKSLFTFQLPLGRSIAVIPKGSRVEAVSRKIVAGKQEWFEVSFTAGPQAYHGWVYAGPVGRRMYIALDAGADKALPTSRVLPAPDSNIRLAEALVQLIPAAFAQTTDPVQEPVVKTNSVQTLFFSLAYVVIFLASVFVAKKWIFKTSAFYSFATGLLVLVIMGFLTQSVFSDILARLLTKSA